MASRGINKVILVGNLGNDPDMKYANNGSAIARLSVATSEQWNDKTTGDKQERTEWHRVVFFGRLAEIAGEYLRKGSQVYIEGSLRTDKYTDANGVEKYSTDIVGREMQMLGGRSGSMGDNAGDAAQQSQYSQPSQQQGQQPQQPQQQSAPQQQQSTQAPNTDFDDDIPF